MTPWQGQPLRLLRKVSQQLVIIPGNVKYGFRLAGDNPLLLFSRQTAQINAQPATAAQLAWDILDLKG